MIISFFDTETTDLVKTTARPLSKQPHIVELFVLQVEQLGEGSLAEFKEIGSYHSFFAQAKPLSEETKRITGIKDEDLAGQPAFIEQAQVIVRLFNSSDRAVAHNLSFDRHMINFELVRCNIELTWPEVICTVEATEYLKGYRLSLSALHEELFGEKFEGAHRAEVDVRAMARCYQELVKKGIIW